MEANRKAITFLLTVAVAVAPLQGSMAKDSEAAGAGHYAEAPDLPTTEPSCSHHNHGTQSGVTNEPRGPGYDEILQTVSSTPGCNYGDGYCSCCGKVPVPGLLSLYSTVCISPQTERIQTSSLFTGTFVLVKTRPPTLGYYSA